MISLAVTFDASESNYRRHSSLQKQVSTRRWKHQIGAVEESISKRDEKVRIDMIELIELGVDDLSQLNRSADNDLQDASSNVSRLVSHSYL